MWVPTRTITRNLTRAPAWGSALCPAFGPDSELAPVATVWAAGSESVKPVSIPGLDGELVLTPAQAITADPAIESEEVVVVGSGMTGIEVSEMLEEQGCHVDLCEMVDQVGHGIFFQKMIDIMSRLPRTDCAMHPDHKLLSVDGNTVTFEDKEGNRTTVGFDHLVLSLGMRPVGAPE
ncbi:MAG: FAD-dependent oxidoreductase [Atopobiaceae bacterium]